MPTIDIPDLTQHDVHRTDRTPTGGRPRKAKRLPIHSTVSAHRPRILRNTPASLLTHVMATPDDGIRRTGRARIRSRVERYRVNPTLLAKPRSQSNGIDGTRAIIDETATTAAMYDVRMPAGSRAHHQAR